MFSTKERRPFFSDKRTRSDLHSYLGGTSRQLECPTLVIGGVEDHVHLLARFGRKITQADWVKELKRVSNVWLKKLGEFDDFQWQAGYAAFSVSASNLDQLKAYIANQERHHRRMTFQDEVRSLLSKYRMKWDERYLWD